MYKGTVERYSEDKGFGYLTQDDGKEILVKRDEIDVSGYKTLTPGERVSFDVEMKGGCLTAKHVAPLP
jgi:CspA family cold shock protein